MLRKRSRPSTCKQALMADYGTLSSPRDNPKKPISSLFSSPRLFTGFASKGLTDSESLMSPTSILDGKPFSAIRSPFWSDSTTPRSYKPENKLHLEKLDSRSVGLGLVDALTDDNYDSKVSKPESRMVVFGSQLKIQIPTLPPSVVSPVQSPNSPPDFGIKTRNSQVGLLSPGLSLPSPAKKSPFSSSNNGLLESSPKKFSALSISEMELSEDYTCVISHGPNPKTTHIFDDCIVERCTVGISSSRKQNGICYNRSMSFPSQSFLSFCYNCKKNLGQGKDIYMYRLDLILLI
ncbi:OLC1v1020012C1 [Oldenlandia corymbosa var. corymbosa]|uniref:OLC1v1020012C1 n=1 Tax=Oldenlandia corymbosa var. corymbosa TaxID=529605 RepID=A0AAV1EFB4_OLDCO|nr:OLC1v1020012C1 [Oldenlandia corymbosa var. corymbosa]